MHALRAALVVAALAGPGRPALAASGDGAAEDAGGGAAVAAVAAARPAPVTAADLRADTWRAAGITAGALVLDLAIEKYWTTSGCRICGTNRLDEEVRDALRWSDTAAASRASDVIAKAAIPVLSVADALRSTRTLGDAGRDVLVVTEAASLSALATSIAKRGFARRRPGVQPGDPSPSANHSLWSSHTSLAFSVAVAQAMQDTLRGDEAAPWVWAIGLTLASSVAYLRIAADAHWATDVLAGAAAGSAFGVAVPVLEKRLVLGVRIAPAPGGIAIRF